MYEWNYNAQYGDHYHYTPDAKETISDVKNVNLHDLEILDIICNYNEYTLIINFVNPKREPLILFFERVKHLSIDIMDRWGAGIYVFDHNINANNIELILNSGDKVVIRL